MKRLGLPWPFLTSDFWGKRDLERLLQRRVPEEHTQGFGGCRTPLLAELHDPKGLLEEHQWIAAGHFVDVDEWN